MTTAKYGMVLHAGTRDTWNDDDFNQQEVEMILEDIARIARVQLLSGAKALDVVQGIVTALEDCPSFNAGRGAVLNEDGEHELEAAIADGASGAYGAVGATRNVENPVQAARAVMEKGRQSFLVGPSADAFARQSGVSMVSNDWFTTTMQKTRWEAQVGKLHERSDSLETVGAVALDIHGDLAAASSTGGLIGKMKGSVGDTAIIGAGLFVDQDVAIVCSGTKEDLLHHSVASKAAVSTKTASLNETIAHVILKKAEKMPSTCAIIAIDSSGHIAVESSGRIFPTATCTSSSSTSTILSTTIPLLTQHIIYQDALVVAGLTRYLITPGHAVVACHGVNELMSLSLPIFLKVMHVARQISATLVSAMSTHRCGLTCDGSGVISLIPLHGLSKDWEAVTYNEEEYNSSFPGYHTSKHGPKMADAFLEQTCSRIAAVKGIKQPFNNHFNGDASNQNIFARIIRGEVPQWRIWEDESHVAFLTPFGNTPGYTVLVPRKHLSSDILGLEDIDFKEILQAAHKVAQHLKEAFCAKRCGIFFEGFAIDYAHVKLIPVHDQLTPQGKLFIPIAPPAPFKKAYEGFLTTQFGPLASDLGLLADSAKQLRKLHLDRTRFVVSKT